MRVVEKPSFQLYYSPTADAGIAHSSLRGVNQIMSSDFLVNASDQNNPKFVLQAKYEEALSDERTIEKLEGSGLNLLYRMDIDSKFNFIDQQANDNIVHSFKF